MKKLVALLFSVLVFCLAESKAESFKRVRVSEEYNMARNESMEMAEEKALLGAKKKAMAKAGADLKVKTTDIELTTSGGEKSSELTNSLTMIEMMAKVRIVGEPTFRHEKRDGGKFYCVCEITADVATSKPNHDPNFKLDIQGIKTAYNSGDKMTFTIKPTQDCYVRIFWITDAINGKGDLLYPMTEYNSDIMLKANRAYRFPLGYADDPDGVEIDYTANAAEAQETNYMIVVGTKRRVAYVGDVDFRRVFEWMDGIDEGERTEWWVKGVGVMK